MLNAIKFSDGGITLADINDMNHIEFFEWLEVMEKFSIDEENKMEQIKRESESKHTSIRRRY